MMEKIEIFRLYRTQCDGAGFAMPLPDITSVEHQPTRPEKDQKTPLRCSCGNTQLPPNPPIRSLRMYCFLAALSTLAESLLEEALLLLLFCCNRSCGRWQASALGSQRAVATTELDGCANRRRLRTCGWVSTGCSVSVAVGHSVTAIRITSILLHDRRSVVNIVTISISLLRDAIGTIEGAVLAAGVCRVCPGSSTIAVLGVCVVRVVVTMLRVESICAVGATRVHTSCILVTAGRSSRDTGIRVTVLATRCVVTATVLRAVVEAARVVVCQVSQYTVRSTINM
jgi:hypothetical protein